VNAVRLHPVNRMSATSRRTTGNTWGGAASAEMPCSPWADPLRPCSYTRRNEQAHLDSRQMSATQRQSRGRAERRRFGQAGGRHGGGKSGVLHFDRVCSVEKGGWAREDDGGRGLGRRRMGAKARARAERSGGRARRSRSPCGVRSGTRVRSRGRSCTGKQGAV
jgi:hypothetical protein